MKLRILDNSLRFRLSQPEVAQLAAGHTVRANTRFPGKACLGYQLRIDCDSTTWDARFDDSIVSVSIPGADGERLTNTNEVTLTTLLSLEGEHSIAIKVEKDFHCLAPRDGEDESALYAHPNAGSTESIC